MDVIKEMRMRNRTAAALFLTGILVFLVCGESSVRTVTGNVEDKATGRMLAGVEVAVSGTAIQSRTDEKGAYEVNGIPLSDFLITFQHPDFLPLDVRISRMEKRGRLVIDAALQKRP
jgi:hypothetical protein